jgi:hypothetical protein
MLSLLGHQDAVIKHRRKCSLCRMHEVLKLLRRYFGLNIGASKSRSRATALDLPAYVETYQKVEVSKTGVIAGEFELFCCQIQMGYQHTIHSMEVKSKRFIV